MASEWVDAQGDPWRFSAVTGTWRKLVNGVWTVSALPSGGLTKVTAGTVAPNAVIVETMGPQGPPGPTGPAAFANSYTLPAQNQNGTTTVFNLPSDADLTQDVQVFRNGLLEAPDTGYTLTSTGVSFTSAPLTTDVLIVVYQKAQ